MKSFAVGIVALALAATPVWASVKDGVDAWQAGNYEKAVAEWRGPAKAGDADAQFNLGQAYKLGRGVPADLKIAQDWYLKAANQDHDQAQANLGLVLFQSGDRKAALPWIEKASARGEPRAQYVLGTALFNGDLMARDWPRAYALMTRAAASGLPQAATSLAQMDRYIPPAERQRGIALARELDKPVATPAAIAPAAPVVPASKTPAPVQTVALPPSTIGAPKPATPNPQIAAPAAPVAPSAATSGWRVQLGGCRAPCVAGAQQPQFRAQGAPADLRQGRGRHPAPGRAARQPRRRRSHLRHRSHRRLSLLHRRAISAPHPLKAFFSHPF
jgi:TPR repeat protein